MNENNGGKLHLAEYIFDEIGNIDESLISSAMGEYPKKRFSFFGRRAFIGAFAAILSLSIFTAAFLAVLNQDGKSDGAPFDQNNSPTQDGVNSSPDHGYASLSVRLEDIRASISGDRLSAEQIKYFDGKARIIVKFSDEEFYRISSVDASELSKIKSELKKVPKNADTDENSLLEGVWISFGNGQVVSPYLRESDGNIGFGSIFDYSAEVEPTDALANLICDILTEK